METDISKESFLYVLERIRAYANEASSRARKGERDPFLEGECLAFDMVNQIIENELL